MSADIPSFEPVQLIAGDSLKWNRTLSSYPPADGWTLHYAITGPYKLASDPVVSVVSGQYQATLAAAATAGANFIPGTYTLRGWVDGVSGEVHTIYRGTLEILPNAYATDHIDRMIAACEAALEGRLGADVESYGREGVQVQKLPLAEIRATLAGYKHKRFLRDNGGSPWVESVIAFGRPGRAPTDSQSLSWPGFDQ